MKTIYKCDICDKEFNSKLALGGHKGSHSIYKGMKFDKKDIYCKNCNKYIKSKSNNNIIDKDLYCSKNCYYEFNKLPKKIISTEEKLNRKMTMRNGDVIDITEKQYLEFKEKAQYCEICGKTTSHKLNDKNIKLLIDHCHITKQFRGILCYSCNVSLSWYENNLLKVNNYLKQ